MNANAWASPQKWSSISPCRSIGTARRAGRMRARGLSISGGNSAYAACCSRIQRHVPPTVPPIKASSPPAEPGSHAVAIFTSFSKTRPKVSPSPASGTANGRGSMSGRSLRSGEIKPSTSTDFTGLAVRSGTRGLDGVVAALGVMPCAGLAEAPTRGSCATSRIGCARNGGWSFLFLFAGADDEQHPVQQFLRGTFDVIRTGR